MKKKFSIFILLAVVVCGIFSFSNNSYAGTQLIELENDYHSTKEQTLTVLDTQGVSYLTTEEYLRTPSGLPIYKTELFYNNFQEVQENEFLEFTKDTEGQLYKGTLKLYRADKEGDSWRAMYSGVITNNFLK